MRLFILVCAIAGLAGAQSGEANYCDGGPGTRDPGQIVCVKTHMKDLILWAYGGDNFQATGPKWIESDADVYDIRAKVPQGVTYAAAQMMMRNLLSERFHLEIHHERRDFPVWELVVAKGGPKFKESAAEFEQKSDYPALGPSGLGSRGVGRTGRRIAAHKSTIGRMVSAVGGFSGRPIIDKTGLTGKYDMWLDFDGRAMMFPDYVADAPALNVAIEQQLGLKFVDARAPFDVVVVDHAEKDPTEN